MAEEGVTPGDNARVSVSLAQLRAELTGLELRLVDRLNGALANKADRAILEQIAARQADGLSRLTILENKALLKDGPIYAKVENIDQEVTSLKTIAGYKKWLWAQTVALCAIAVPMGAFILDHWVSGV